MERRRVGILVFEGVEVLDFCGPFEVFSVTRLDEERPGGTQRPVTAHEPEPQGDSDGGIAQVQPELLLEEAHRRRGDAHHGQHVVDRRRGHDPHEEIVLLRVLGPVEQRQEPLPRDEGDEDARGGDGGAGRRQL